MSRIYLTNLASDVSGYKLALIDQRPMSGSSDATAVTTATALGDNIAMTLTAGGTTAKWITKPMLADVAIKATPVYVHFPALESAGTVNAGIGLRLAEYTSSEQSAFLDYNHTVELGTTAALSTSTVFVTSVPSATTIDAGNRLVIAPDIVAVGSMASGTVTMTYNGATEDGTGDAFIEISENFRTNESQMGSGTNVILAGQGKGKFTAIIDGLEFFQAAGVISQAQPIIDMLTLERNNN